MQDTGYNNANLFILELDRIIHNDKNGVIKYDPDGTGSKDATKFAVVDAKLGMSNIDFWVI